MQFHHIKRSCCRFQLGVIHSVYISLYVRILLSIWIHWSRFSQYTTQILSCVLSENQTSEVWKCSDSPTTKCCHLAVENAGIPIRCVQAYKWDLTPNFTSNTYKWDLRLSLCWRCECCVVRPWRWRQYVPPQTLIYTYNFTWCYNPEHQQHRQAYTVFSIWYYIHVSKINFHEVSELERHNITLQTHCIT
jgi:hypothetical protein